MKKLLSTAALIVIAILACLFFSKNDGVLCRDTISTLQDPTDVIKPKDTKHSISASGEKRDSQTTQGRDADFVSAGKSQEYKSKPIDMKEQILQNRIKKIAQQRLEKMNIDYAGRDVLIEKGDGVIICIFIKPKGIRGGDFTVVLDAVTEKIIDMEIQR
jgi:D-alanine-D-alanine ligase-like ATP-grasp enzyme